VTSQVEFGLNPEFCFYACVMSSVWIFEMSGVTAAVYVDVFILISMS